MPSDLWATYLETCLMPGEPDEVVEMLSGIHHAELVDFIDRVGNDILGRGAEMVREARVEVESAMPDADEQQHADHILTRGIQQHGRVEMLIGMAMGMIIGRTAALDEGDPHG